MCLGGKGTSIVSQYIVIELQLDLVFFWKASMYITKIGPA